MSAIKVFILVSIISVIQAKVTDELKPRFVGSGTNTTVVEGREATLTCTVENLQSYKVAWLRVDTQTILTIGPHVITKNHRVGVSRGDADTWSLTLKDARPTDGGPYMCQINTEPMITQTYYLQVFVPPDIVDSGSSGEVMVREGDNVSLHCSASGTPEPSIVWRREDAAHMNVGGEKVTKWIGEWLNMTSVSRSMNGAFLCIATNGVPPSVSKRVTLHVMCKPTVRMIQKMVGGYIGEAITLQCTVEVYPPPLIYWTHFQGNKLLNGTKHQAYIKSQGYKHTALLRIANVSRDDIGSYYCHADNSLGTDRDDVTLYTLVTTTGTPTTISTTLETSTVAVESTTEPYLEHDKIKKKDFLDEDHFVVVLSRHQMQNFDLTSSS